MELPALILASASPRRKQLFKRLDLQFRVVPAEIEETIGKDLSQHEICRLNAFYKARAVSSQAPEALVIGVDTLVSIGETHLGKPATFDQAREMLALLQGQTHCVVSGVCLLHAGSSRQKTFTVATFVTFRRLRDSEIDHYLQSIDPLDKAGGYAIQEQGDQLVETVAGSYTNVVGLPLETLQEALKEFALPAIPPPHTETEMQAG